MMRTAASVVRRSTLVAIGLVWAVGCATTDFDRGRNLLEAGDPDAALSLFDAAIQAGVRVDEATRERGAAQLAKGQLEEAVATLEPLREQRPNDQRVYWLLGQCYSRASRPADAADAYRAYEALTSRRSVRKQIRLRVAQLQAEVDDGLAQEIMQRQAGGIAPPANSVAVFAFAPEAGETAPLQDQKICRALNIWVTADLAKVERIRAIAASQLDIIYREQNFTYENRQIFVPDSLVRPGNVQPARHMVRGLYGSHPGQQIAMAAACFDVEANSSQNCSTRAGDERDLFDLETQLVLDLLKIVGVEPTAQERIAIGEKPTRNLDAFLAFADGVYLRDIGNLEAAAAAFSEAAKIDPGFTMAKEHESASQADGMQSSVNIEAPLPVSTAMERAQSSAAQLGLGLIPDSSGGDQQGGTTNDVTSARGDAVVRLRAQTGTGGN